MRASRGRRFATLPTHRKKRDEWGTQSVGEVNGAVEKQVPRASLRDDKY
ncbi:MAG TPA: hypothetical protein VGB94_01535 [Acidobacteriaceae bacterium]